MANKKYSEFSSGTYDASKIFLQADALTGALTKVPLPFIGSLPFLFAIVYLNGDNTYDISIKHNDFPGTWSIDQNDTGDFVISSTVSFPFDSSDSIILWQLVQQSDAYVVLVDVGSNALEFYSRLYSTNVNTEVSAIMPLFIMQKP